MFLSHSRELHGLPGNKSSNIQKFGFFKFAAANGCRVCVGFFSLLTDLFMSCFGLVIMFCHHKIKWDKRNYNSQLCCCYSVVQQQQQQQNAYAHQKWY